MQVSHDRLILEFLEVAWAEGRIWDLVVDGGPFSRADLAVGSREERISRARALLRALVLAGDVKLYCYTDDAEIVDLAQDAGLRRIEDVDVWTSPGKAIYTALSDAGEQRRRALAWRFAADRARTETVERKRRVEPRRLLAAAGPLDDGSAMPFADAPSISELTSALSSRRTFDLPLAVPPIDYAMPLSSLVVRPATGTLRASIDGRSLMLSLNPPRFLPARCPVWLSK